MFHAHFPPPHEWKCKRKMHLVHNQIKQFGPRSKKKKENKNSVIYIQVSQYHILILTHPTYCTLRQLETEGF